MLNTEGGTLPDAVVILRDQAEGHLLCQMNYIAAWMNIPDSDVLGRAQAQSRAQPGPFEPGPAWPMLWALRGLGPRSRFLRPEARAQAWAFNPFILHMYPPVLWHDPTGWPPDAWELNISFFFFVL